MDNISVTAYSGFMPIVLIIIALLIGSLIFAIILRKRGKLILIPLGIFVLISVYVWMTISSIKESTSEFDAMTSEENLKKLYEASTSPEQLVEIGQIFTLTGNLMFREYDGKINLGDLTQASTHRDSISNMYDYINFETDIKDGSSIWNIIYMDSVDFTKASEFKYEDLKKDKRVVEMVLKSEKLSDNEWLCLKIIDIEIKNGHSNKLID
nr:hypothetical protein [uncultured Carboxylicivirga sp.]